LIGTTVTLPLGIAAGWGRPPTTGQAFWLIGLLAASIGLPFFALAANAPLLQAWFARSEHPAAQDPYFLCGASNVGRFLSILACPLAIEPLIGLNDQARLWSLGFGLLILLIATESCGRIAAKCESLANPPSRYPVTQGRAGSGSVDGDHSRS